MLKSNKVLMSAVLAMLAAASANQAHAAGFSLIENSASGQGNAFAGAAALATDASTVWFNPAGMMRLKQDQIVAAGHIISPKSSFSNGNTTDGLGGAVSGANDDGGSDALVPNLYAVKTIDKNMKIGIGINAPFGLATNYDDNWVGRYHAVETDLRTLNFNPSIAFRVTDSLVIGAGINFMFADVILTSAIDMGALFGLPQQADGFGDLTGNNYSDISTGINFGILYDVSEATRLGFSYRSEVTIDITGRADFTVPVIASPLTNNGLFLDTGLHSSVTLPQSMSLSVAHEMDKLTLLGDITWIGWNSFEELRISYDNPNQPDSVTTEGWDNTFRFSFGADYVFDDRLTLRTGIAYDQTPIPGAERRTARIPDNDRTWLSFGGTYLIDKEFSIDIGYSHLFVDDVTINNTFESSQPALNGTLNGTYSASVDILSAQLRWNY